VEAGAPCSCPGGRCSTSWPHHHRPDHWGSGHGGSSVHGCFRPVHHVPTAHHDGRVWHDVLWRLCHTGHVPGDPQAHPHLRQRGGYPCNQHSTAQHSTAQHSTAQHSTAQRQLSTQLQRRNPDATAAPVPALQLLLWQWQPLHGGRTAHTPSWVHGTPNLLLVSVMLVCRACWERERS
jgi:hypothetical protein